MEKENQTQTKENNTINQGEAKNFPNKGGFNDRKPGGGRRFGGRGKAPRVKPEFDQKIVNIRRVARVVTGGRRFSFSVALVAGNRKGSVGVGTGKSTDTPSAIEKAFRDAQKNMVQLSLTKDFSIPFEIRGKVCGSEVIMMPAPGKGLLAGSSIRDVLELAGVKNINAKILSRSKNRLNNAKAALKALEQISKDK